MNFIELLAEILLLHIESEDSDIIEEVKADE